MPPRLVHIWMASARAVAGSVTHTATHCDPCMLLQAPRAPAWLQPDEDQMSGSSGSPLQLDITGPAPASGTPAYSVQKNPVWLVHEPSRGGGQAGVSEPLPQPARTSTVATRTLMRPLCLKPDDRA